MSKLYVINVCLRSGKCKLQIQIAWQMEIEITNQHNVERKIGRNNVRVQGFTDIEKAERDEGESAGNV